MSTAQRKSYISLKSSDHFGLYFTACFHFPIYLQESELLINNLRESIIKKTEVILSVADLKTMANLQESTVKQEVKKHSAKSPLNLKN